MKAAMRAPIKSTRGQRDYVRREQTKVAQCNASGSRTRAMKADMRAPMETTRSQRDNMKRKQTLNTLKTERATLMYKNAALEAEIANLREGKKIEQKKPVPVPQVKVKAEVGGSWKSQEQAAGQQTKCRVQRSSSTSQGQGGKVVSGAESRVQCRSTEFLDR
jgi:predicted  nucleic acid-binding Zn-ribbon protein